ncbi:MAG: TolB family protein [Methylacidiphilales bacterium]|nr:TolB family protein [Candidatus Methylacidiphilales bacterium]
MIKANLKHLCLLLPAAFCLLNHLSGQEIEVVGENKIKIYAAPISGPNGSAATALLQTDLKLSGDFVIATADAAAFTAKGSLGATGLAGSLSGSQNFNQTFPGDWRSAVHQFADAIVQAVTGSPGIATSRVVFVAADSGHKELYLMDLDGGVVRELTKDNSTNLGPKFNAQGNLIAFTSFKSGYPDVWLLDLGASNKRRISFYPGLNSGPSFSPDGSRVALTLSKDGNTELYTIASGGGSPERLTHSVGTEASPTYSPDGGRIAYVSDDRGSAQLYIIASNGGAPQRFNTYSPYTTEPDWSPDGRLLAYSVRIAGQNQIAISEIVGGKQTILTASGINETPSWCRNSRHLVFSRDGKLYLLDSKTKQTVQLDNGLNRCSEPAVSR